MCGGCLIHYVLWRDAVGGIPTGATTIPLNSISANKVASLKISLKVLLRSKLSLAMAQANLTSPGLRMMQSGL